MFICSNQELFVYKMSNQRVKITYKNEQHHLDLDLIDNVKQLRIALRSYFKYLPQNFDIVLQNLSGNSLSNEEIYLMKNYDHNTILFIKSLNEEEMDIESISSQLSRIQILDNTSFKEQIKEQLKDFDQQQPQVHFEQEQDIRMEKKVQEISFQSLKKEQKLIKNQKQVLNEEIQCNCCFSFPIQGIIYKCLICQDYDLCQQCQKSKHQFHPLLKITKKGQYPSHLKVKFSKKSQIQMEKMAQTDKTNEQKLKRIKYHGKSSNYKVIDPSTLPSQKICQKNFVAEIIGSID